MESRGPEGGKIISFYSYKGGTGRSMALANVAWILASQGHRVLVLDWDLEAPGLHRYFHPFLTDKDLAASEGIIDFVVKFATAATTPGLLPKREEQASKKSATDGDSGEGATDAGTVESEQVNPDWYKPYANILRYARSLDWRFEGKGTLDFIPAGRQGSSYSTRVNSFNWSTFYERLGGGAMLEEAKRKMREEYDYILIDSRTGVSDTAGVCTVQMPDMLVVCFTLNNQSIEGASAVATAVHEQRARMGREIEIFPVPTRVETAEQDKRIARSSYAKEKFSPFPLHKKINRDEYWTNVPVLYIPYYAYEEILAAFGAKDDTIVSFLAATERLTGYLTGSDGRLRPPDPELRKEKLALYEGRRVETSPAKEQGKAAEYLFSSLNPEEQDVTRRIFLRLVRVASTSDVDGNTRRQASLRDFGEEAGELIEALSNARLLEVVTEPSTGGSEVIQIAQDALLQGWKRLQDWIKEDRKFLLWRQEELQPAVGRWEQHQRDGELLLRGSALREARTWILRRKADLLEAEQLFIQTSLARDQREQEREHGGQRRAPSDGLSSEAEREAIAQATSILRGKAVSWDELWRLAQQLKAARSFGLARRILERALSEQSLLKEVPQSRVLAAAQQLAICTYKDPDIPVTQRLDRALEILNSHCDLGQTKDQPTLGIVGSIYKRRWQVDGFKHHLERSLAYFRRGYGEGAANDLGYTGINAAFVQDLLASQEAEEAIQAGTSSTSADARRAEATRIRQDVAATLHETLEQPGNEYLQENWWFLVTLAEAHFGLKQYQEALSWMERAAQLKVPDGEREATAQQFVTLARLQDETINSSTQLEGSEVWQVLRAFFGEDVAAVRMAFLGKVGLALSGGGFRAALFHIGVLARLAELDVLRYVETISCVSGGSIVGSHYYLELRNLLQQKRDSEITREDYIEIVRRMEQDFLLGVQRNIRTRASAEWLTNLKSILSETYTRTMRIGELYEREIFSRVGDGVGKQPRWLHELYVFPMGERENFRPKYDNWRRVAKVPDLILNATTLNTGHNWQFTTSWMGESPSSVDHEIDSNDRLRRMYYHDAPGHYGRVRLGHAVAASCSAPGLFEPLALPNLYPDRVVRLVDGSFKDGQGVGGLLEHDCTVVLASDASGQMSNVLKPRGGFQNTLLRSFAILIHSLRESNYHELAARRTSSLLRGMMFVHLKKDLDAREISTVGGEHLDPVGGSTPTPRASLTGYGISKEIQEGLANIRSDFDSFTEVEAYALMTSGYRMADFEFASSIKGFPPQANRRAPWRFLVVESLLKGEDPAPGAHDRFMKLLAAARSSVFKTSALSRAYMLIMYSLGFLLSSAMIYGLYMLATRYVKPMLLEGGGPLNLLLLALAVAYFPLLYFYSYRPLDFIIDFYMIIFGAFFARIRLHISDPLYLRMGSLARILGNKQALAASSGALVPREEGKTYE